VVLKRPYVRADLFLRNLYKSDKDIPNGRPSSLAYLC